MMRERVFVLAGSDREVLGGLRAVPGLQAAEAAGELWRRGLPATGELPLAVRALPATAAYTLDGQGRLFPLGSRTPTAQLPALAWLPIQVFVPLELPTAALPAQGAPRYRVRLVPSGRAEAGAALLTTLAFWREYAETCASPWRPTSACCYWEHRCRPFRARSTGCGRACCCRPASILKRPCWHPYWPGSSMPMWMPCYFSLQMAAGSEF
jgi:hypothetical protein